MLQSVHLFSLNALALALVATAPMHVSAHGTLAEPKPTFPDYGGGFSAEIESSTSILTDPTGKDFKNDDENAEAFDTAFRATGLTLRDFMLKYQDISKKSESLPVTAACGYSDPRGKPQALPEKLRWDGKFVHPGPCEAWCDDELVMPYTGNCWVDYKDGVMPYSKDKCVGKKQLTFYWLGVDNPQWQVYIDCVPLAGALAGNSSAAPTQSPVSKTPTPTPTLTPIISKTPAPAPTPDDSKTPAPTPVSKAPAPSPSPSASKGCTTRKAKASKQR